MYTQRQWKVTSIKISIFWKIYNTALWLLLRSCFWSTTNWFGEIKQFHEPWNYGACDTRAFYVFRRFKEFEIIICRRKRARTCPRHFHWKRHQNGLGYPIKRIKWTSNFKVAPKLCIFLYNAMETIGVRQGLSIMHLGVMDTVFHSCDALDSMAQTWVLKYPQLFVQNEFNIVLC